MNLLLSKNKALFLLGLTTDIILLLLLSSSSAGVVVDAFAAAGYRSPLFPAVNKRTVPSKTKGVDIELPNFDELFDRIKEVSPLARQVIQQRKEKDVTRRRGLAALVVDDDDHHHHRAHEKSSGESLKWKLLEARPKRTLHRIEKIDNFKDMGSPMLRFRATISGPCLGMPLANFIMNLEDRQKWDQQIKDVYEIYTVQDLDAVNGKLLDVARYGQCNKMGIGYAETKSNFGIPPREQLTLCGVHDFVDEDDGTCLIWGAECPDWMDRLLPPSADDKRHTRARSHLFCITVVPAGPDRFDVEYILQMDTGGSLPHWLTNPVLINSIKSYFRHAEEFYGGKRGELELYLREQKEQHDAEQQQQQQQQQQRNGISLSTARALTDSDEESGPLSLVERTLRPVVRFFRKQLGTVAKYFVYRDLGVGPGRRKRWL
jgi:hypothetical protein